MLRESKLSFEIKESFIVCLIAELKKHAPMLYKLLSSCTKTIKDSTSIIGLCASVIFKFRHSSMSLVQWMLSTVLFAGRK